MKKSLLTLTATLGLSLVFFATSCSSRKVASAKASDASSAKPEEENPAKAAEKSTASNDGADKPLTVTGEIAGSEVFIKGRTVEIWAKWCCDHEVTQAEYQSVMGSNPSNFSGSSHPVENVSWYDAIIYCNKKSVATGRTPCYKVNGKTDTKQWGYTPHKSKDISGNITCDFTADGYRLPTEAEWEYFARGGNTSNSGQTEYSGSNTIGSIAWYDDNSGNKTHEVKTKAANALGLYDMSGNVDEWCWDGYSGDITTSTPSDGAAPAHDRILRGGSCDDSASVCAVSYRRCSFPGDRYYGLNGFRVVCSVSKNDAESTAAKNESDKKNASSSGANKPLMVTGKIADSEVFIKGRTVEIWAKWCCDHEVTQGEYEKYCNYGKNAPEKQYGKGGNYPAYYVSWYDALVYCNKRSIAEGLTPCYKIKGKTNPSEWGAVPVSSNATWDAATCDFDANGYRLPTEAEWEYFARGGNTSNSGQTTYSGSNDIEEVAWYMHNSYGKAHEVKKKSPNAKGLYDMTGNVCEWCWDVYSDTIRTGTSFSGATSGSERVKRGSGWDCYADIDSGVSYRSYGVPPYDRSGYNVGFRVVRSSLSSGSDGGSDDYVGLESESSGSDNESSSDSGDDENWGWGPVP